ncbi:MAG: hypothetical protein H6710_06225 [Myxococcales bacterium]|nr:hypothetical protein [Myxococcales bacterium]
MLLRIWIVAALTVGGLSAGCAVDLENDLEGEPCVVEDDCWRTQECSRTPEEAQLNLFGTCRPEGTVCIPGAQLGCACNPVDPSIGCLSSALPGELNASYPSMTCDPMLLRCVIAPPGGGM